MTRERKLRRISLILFLNQTTSAQRIRCSLRGSSGRAAEARTHRSRSQRSRRRAARPAAGRGAAARSSRWSGSRAARRPAAGRPLRPAPCGSGSDCTYPSCTQRVFSQTAWLTWVTWTTGPNAHTQFNVIEQKLQLLPGMNESDRPGGRSPAQRDCMWLSPVRCISSHLNGVEEWSRSRPRRTRLLMLDLARRQRTTRTVNSLPSRRS